ncbi:cryptochrome/photolyase family protein [Haloferula chungangensis]|uniref:Cryptochrome/photolyase family protein n=1 Tax=Haloferula chungangensis TaxID=1048331 RepID=A0ABW2L5V7_9BACT
MPREHPLAIHWFRRDLRILDNPGLYHAAKSAERVIPSYLLSNWTGQHHWTGPNRQKFLCEALASLDKNLQTVGGRLILRSGDAVEALLELVDESGARAIFYNEDPDPYGKSTEERLKAACESRGLACHGYHDVTLHAPHEVLTQSGDPYRVFTPYSKNWLGLEKPEPFPKPRSLGTPDDIPSDGLPTLAHWKLPEAGEEILEAGEKAAHNRLGRALEERLAHYKDHRDIPSISGTTRISQDLRFGLISPRTVYAKAAELLEKPSESEGVQTFIKELAWREFYMAILHHYPEVLEKEFNRDWRGLPWDEPGETFAAWKEGRTGFPIIDAGIRELRATGFMHNRVRMIVAMFLTKDLHIDWRLGEQFFMQQLTDGEIASNNGGWQWSAGTGADAAPYFRIQNPWSQTKRYDPKGEYIKRWVPELKDVPAKQLMEPPADGKPIASDYPLPCVDHKAERERTLSIFKKHKQSSGR